MRRDQVPSRGSTRTDSSSQRAVVGPLVVSRSQDRRIAWIAWGLLLLFIIATYGQARVQVFRREDLMKNAVLAKRHQVGRTEYSRRGAIYSADGKILAQSEDAYELVLDFTKVPTSPAFFMELSAATGLPASELSSRPVRGRSRVWRKTLGDQGVREVQSVRSRWRADGLSLAKTLSREYPLSVAASGVVGYLLEGKPAAGLELSQNKALAGEDGFTLGMVDRAGSFLPMLKSEHSRPAQDGNGLTLTLDSTLQLAATQAIRVAVERHRADSGVAIVLEPSTGDLLAMANWPSIEPETATGGTGFNPAYMGAYEPGSTFKILTLAKALDCEAAQEDQHLFCKGELALNKFWRVRCDMHHGARAHGDTDLEKAIAKSCNVSAASWALKIGHPEMVKYLEQLGLLDKTQLGLPLERAGMFNRKEYAKPLQLATVGFGQSMTATPVALASAFAMLGNSGVRVQPRLIKSVGVSVHEVKAAGQIVQPESATIVLRLMESVVESDMGTGASLRIPGYRLAGKTGTAQKVNKQTGKVGDGGYVASFVGFVPAGQPRALILVMVDNPKGGAYYGALVAGPVFLELAKTVIRHFHIPPQPKAAQTFKPGPKPSEATKAAPKASKSQAEHTL